MEDITSMLSGMGAIQRVTRETQLPRTSLVPLLVALGRAFSSSAAAADERESCFLMKNRVCFCIAIANY